MSSRQFQYIKILKWLNVKQKRLFIRALLSMELCVLAPIYSFATWQHVTLYTSIAFYYFIKFFRGHAQKSKLREEKVTYVLRPFLLVSFFSFSYLLAVHVDLLLGFLLVQSQTEYHRDEKFWTKSSQGKFCSEFSTINLTFSCIFQAWLT